MTGPKTGAITIGMDSVPITRAIRSLPAWRTRIICPAGMVSAPAAPCSTRKPISSPSEEDRPQATEASVKIAIDHMYTRRAPRRSQIQPASGSTAASASR